MFIASWYLTKWDNTTSDPLNMSSIKWWLASKMCTEV